MTTARCWVGLFLVLGLCVGVLSASAPPAGATYSFVTKWGIGPTGDGGIDDPSHLASDTAGDVYLTDAYNDRIQKFSDNGAFLARWNVVGKGNLGYGRAGDIATSPGGGIYVANRATNQIEEFTSDGTLLTRWGGQGSDDGEFNDIQGITAGLDGSVFVLDLGWASPRVQKFTPDGTFVRQWGGYGTGDGQFIFPLDIATGPLGRVYVTDSWRDSQNRRIHNDSVQEFTLDGAFISKWGDYGTGDGQFNTPDGISTDADGAVYVVDSDNHRIQKFTSDGAFVTEWGFEGTGDGQFSDATDIATGIRGSVYVGDNVTPGHDRVQKFSSDGGFYSAWTNGDPSDFVAPEGVATDAQGLVYVADTDNDRIQQFALDGRFLISWGKSGTGNGEFHYPTDVATDSEGNVYVADFLNDRVQKFSRDGEFIAQWSVPNVEGIATDAQGYVYASRSRGMPVQKYTLDGVFVGEWGTDFQVGATGIATDSASHVYVTEIAAGGFGGKVHKYTSNGVLLATWGRDDRGLSQPWEVATDVHGNVYVTDNYSIKKFTPGGDLLTRWGSYGSGDGQFGAHPGQTGPQGTATDANGNVYVADTGNGRIQKFAELSSAPPSPIPSPFTSTNPTTYAGTGAEAHLPALSDLSLNVRCVTARTKLIRCTRKSKLKPRLVLSFTSNEDAAVKVKVTGRTKARHHRRRASRTVLSRTLDAKAGADKFVLSMPRPRARERLKATVTVVGGAQSQHVRVAQ